LRRMYGEVPEDIYYYLTLYNEPYPQPAEPDDVDVEGLLRGMHRISDVQTDGPHVQLLASGVAVNWALKAQQMLQDEFGVGSSVWSVTSWNELRRDGLHVDRHNMLHPSDEPKHAFVEQQLGGAPGPVIAVSDWMRAVPDQIREWVSQPFVSLGTDGWGMSDTRGALRRHFLVDAESIVVQSLIMLAKDGTFDRGALAEVVNRYELNDPSAAHAGNTEGSG
jgi:pyruvate dehydrogenase E1 component